MSNNLSKPFLSVLGGGVAGLASAYLAAKTGKSAVVIEKRDIPGGLSLTRRTPDGYYYDLGGHRYYSPSKYLMPFLKNLLGDELIWSPRKSRFYLDGKFFDYPVQFTDVIKKLPLSHSFRMLIDYLAEKFRGKNRKEDNYQDWMIHRFGRKLYEFNFENYTRKVWGMPPSELSAEWAASRIKGLSLGKILQEFLSRKSNLATLIDKFLYPRHGIGQISNFMQTYITSQRNKVYLGEEVVRLKHNGRRIHSVTFRNSNGRYKSLSPEYIASSINIDSLVRALEPQPPFEVLQAADNLRYRGLVVLFIRINASRVTDDSWIYFPDESLPFGRWHEPKNWSADMVPDKNHSSLVVEFFANEDEYFWKASAQELLELTIKHARRLGLLDGSEVGNVEKVLVPEAYPIWNLGYKQHLECILGYLERFNNLSLIGRNGRFYYCTIDESLISGFAAAANFIEGKTTLPSPLPVEIPNNALGYLGLSVADLKNDKAVRWSRND